VRIDPQEADEGPDQRLSTDALPKAGNGAWLDPQGRQCTPTRENRETCTHRQEDVQNAQPASCAGLNSVSPDIPALFCVMSPMGQKATQPSRGPFSPKPRSRDYEYTL
jgi:hypothetical protein